MTTEKSRITQFCWAVILAPMCAIMSLDAAENYSLDEFAGIDAYLFENEAEELALARSAAPAHIAEDAGLLVLRKSGYSTVKESGNGFVCLVERAWNGNFYYVGAFWDPQILAPVCYNEEAATHVLPAYMLRTQLAMDGKSRAEIRAALDKAVSSGEFKAPTGTAMSYMLSAGQYLHPDIGKWLPHLMIWMPYTAQKDWGQNKLAGINPVVFRNPGGPFAMVVIPYDESRFIQP